MAESNLGTTNVSASTDIEDDIVENIDVQAGYDHFYSCRPFVAQRDKRV